MGVDACEELVEGVDAGLASKAVVEGCFDLSPECCLGLLGVRAEFPVDGRDVTADPVDPPLRVGGEGRPLPEEPVDVNPAEDVIVTEVELAGAVTGDDGALTQSSVVEESAVAGAPGGDEAGPLAGDPQLVEVTVPCPGVLGIGSPPLTAARGHV